MIQIPEFWTILTQALGWTVLHSIWQISLIFVIFKAFYWLYELHNRAGYVCALVAMSLAAVWSGITFFEEFERIQSLHALQSEASAAVVFPENTPLQPAASPLISPPASPEIPLKDSIIDWLEKQSALLGWIWFLGVAALFLRLLGGYLLAQRLRSKGTSAPNQQFSDLCRQWSDRLGVRRNIQLLESKYVTEPLTLGFWKPVILFPAGMLLQLSPVQVEALLLHELAHVRRYDYLVNLLQLSLDTFFFYHPLFWLLSGEARRRREYCCDDTVLRYSRHRLEYARTLTEIKLNPVHHQNPFAMNALGNDHFSIRILRIAGISAQRSNRSALLLLVLLLTGMTTILCVPAITNAAAPGAFSLYPEPVQGLDAASFSGQNGSNLVQANKSNAAPESQAVPAPAVKENVLPAPAIPDTSAPGSAVAIELNKMNVCYIGVDNPLQIAVDGVPSSQLSVRLKGEGSISGSNGQYVARFLQPGTAQIEVYRQRGGTQTLLVSKEYRIKRVPDPIPVMGGMKGGAISLEQLLKYKELTALLANFDYDAVCNVVGFEITILPVGTDAVSMPVQSNVLPEAMRERMKELTPGAAVFFDDVLVKCPGDGAARNIGGLVFKIK